MAGTIAVKIKAKAANAQPATNPSSGMKIKYRAWISTTPSRSKSAMTSDTMEMFTMPSAVTAADQAVKTADVDLIEIRLGRGLAGKAFVVLTGEVAAVRAAVDAGVKVLSDQAMLLATSVIPSPHPDVLDKLL